MSQVIRLLEGYRTLAGNLRLLLTFIKCCDSNELLSGFCRLLRQTTNIAKRCGGEDSGAGEAVLAGKATYGRQR